MKTYWSLIAALMFNMIASAENHNYWEKAYTDSGMPSSPSDELITHLLLESHYRILDIGCGCGEVTSTLADAVPLGFVLGIDRSPIIIDSAKKSHAKNNLLFATIDAQDIDFENEFHIVFSLSSLQLIPDQKTVIENAKKALRPGGMLYFQMPAELPPAMNDAIEETIASEKWAPYFTTYTSPLSFFSEETYAHHIYEAGLEEKRIEAQIRTHVFPSKNAFVSFLLQWFPYLEPLPRGKKMHFLNEVITKYLATTPPSETRSISFPVKRLTVIAQKPDED